MAVAQAAELGLQARRRDYTGQDSEACQGITDAPMVPNELRRLEREMSRMRRLVGNLLDAAPYLIGSGYRYRGVGPFAGLDLQ